MSQQGAAGGGIALGRPFGIPVYLSWSWLVAGLVITWVFAPQVSQQLPGLSGAYAVAVAACFAVLLGLSVLAHELAHSVAALRFGQRVNRITLHLLGGVSEIASESRRPGPDAVIVVVGPLTSLLLAAVGYGLLHVLGEGTVLRLVAWQVAVTNLVVGLFNLVPGLPLDGGRLLRDAVWAVTGREQTGTVVAAWTGRLVAVLLVGVAIVPFLLVQDAVWLIWGLLLASFIWVEAGRAITQSRVRQGLGTIEARALTRRAVPVPDDLSVAEAVRQGLAAHASALVVVDRDRRPTGVVSDAAVAAVPEQRRPWVPVVQVSRSLEPGLSIPVTLGGEDLLSWLDAHPAAEYLVVEPDGTVYGVLSRDDVARAVSSLAVGRGRARG